MKLGFLLVACVGCSQASPPPAVASGQPEPAKPCPVATPASPVAEPAAAPPAEAGDASATTPEIEGFPSPELDGTIAFTEYNEALDRIQPPWQSDPGLVVARALDAAGFAQTTITIELFSGTHRTTDSANLAKATIIRDGFTDDSIRGTRYRLELRLDSERNAWRISAAKADWRCWRGHADYSTVLCK